MSVIDRLPRAWRALPLKGLRDGDEMFPAFAIDELPPIDQAAFDNLDWLRGLNRVKWSIATPPDIRPARPFRRSGLDALGIEVQLPREFAVALEQPSLLDRVHASTGSYLDLADFAVPIDEPDGGVLIHFLSDQQWVRHWLLYLEPSGVEAVVTSEEAIGYRSTPHYETPTSPLSPDFHDLEYCSPSFGEFMYRYWLEGELFYRLRDGRLGEPFESYARHYRLHGAAPPAGEPMW